LQEVKASMPHPAGAIQMQLKRRGKEGVRGEITLPPGLNGSFVWQGKTLPLQPGVQKINL
jgi:hypothetical protein